MRFGCWNLSPIDAEPPSPQCLSQHVHKAGTTLRFGSEPGAEFFGDSPRGCDLVQGNTIHSRDQVTSLASGR